VEHAFAESLAGVDPHAATAAMQAATAVRRKPRGSLWNRITDVICKKGAAARARDPVGRPTT
jgi:hypothetical protein